MKTSATAPTVQIKIVLNHEHYAHFVSKLEQEGCNSLTEMFRKAIFNKWPLQNQGGATSSLPVRWRIAGSGDAAPPGVEVNRGQRERCPSQVLQVSPICEDLCGFVGTPNHH